MASVLWWLWVTNDRFAVDFIQLFSQLNTKYIKNTLIKYSTEKNVSHIFLVKMFISNELHYVTVKGLNISGS